MSHDGYINVEVEPEAGEVGPEARTEVLEEATGDNPEESVGVHLTEAARIEETVPPAGFATDQVSVPANAGAQSQLTRVAGKATGRLAVVIQPIGGDVLIGNARMTQTTGFRVTDGSALRFSTSADIFAIAVGGAVTVYVASELRRALNL